MKCEYCNREATKMIAGFTSHLLDGSKRISWIPICAVCAYQAKQFYMNDIDGPPDIQPLDPNARGINQSEPVQA